jgi:hypothetical protein
MLLALACTPAGDLSSAPPRGDCNPVEESHCLLPYPSDFYLASDLATPTGRRLDFGPTSLPQNLDGAAIDPAAWNELDGFPVLGTLFAHLPGGSLDGTASNQDIGAYLAPDAKTAILDPSGGRHPHFVERETRAPEDRSLLLIRPVVPFAHATTYVVGVSGLDGAQAPDGFAALRDGAETTDPDLEAQREHYEQVVFPALEAAGFARADLQMAWSFTTASAESSLGRARWIRDDALSRGEPAWTVGDVVDFECADGARIGREVEGSFRAPLYLTSPDPGSRLNRNDTGQPSADGEVDVPFLARIPCSLHAAARSAQAASTISCSPSPL